MHNSKVNLRELVLEALLAVTRDQEYSHIVIRSVLDKYQYLDKQERSFFKRVCEGTLEHRIWIDYVINQFSKVKVNKMKPVIRCILQSSVYELKYMDGIPASATCNEAVKLAQKKGFQNLKGFVNGVLRNINRGMEQISLPDPIQEPLRYLSIRYSMPEWILEMWKESYSLIQIKEFLQAFLLESPLSIRINPLRTTKEDLKRELEAAQITVREHPTLPDVLYLEGYDSLARIAAFQEGKFSVQDTSSMQVALLADPKPGDYVLDVCAAPGGKSIHLAEQLLLRERQSGESDTAKGMVEARDLTAYKVSLIEENIERCGLTNIHAVQADARLLDQTQVQRADIVIADLPCSGLGVLGRKADIKYRITQQACEQLAVLQREILGIVQQYVKPGGILIYSTCTIQRAENEENVAWFLQKYSEFCLEEQRQILPKKGENDGFFLAKLRKESR